MQFHIAIIHHLKFFKYLYPDIYLCVSNHMNQVIKCDGQQVVAGSRINNLNTLKNSHHYINI